MTVPFKSLWCQDESGGPVAQSDILSQGSLLPLPTTPAPPPPPANEDTGYIQVPANDDISYNQVPGNDDVSYNPANDDVGYNYQVPANPLFPPSPPPPVRLTPLPLTPLVTPSAPLTNLPASSASVEPIQLLSAEKPIGGQNEYNMLFRNYEEV